MKLFGWQMTCLMAIMDQKVQQKTPTLVFVDEVWFRWTHAGDVTTMSNQTSK